MTDSLVLNGRSLDLQGFLDVARFRRPVSLCGDAMQKVRDSFAAVTRIAASGVPTYGISTGFGELSKVVIAPGENARLQTNLLRSHACAVGEPLLEEQVRGMMLLRLNTILIGYSGANPSICELLAELLNRNIVPVVPSQGSLGASGDLANLAHMALVLIGEGEAVTAGKRLPGGEALRDAGLEPVRLSGKDGLALINGTQLMTSVGALAVADALALVKTAAASLSLSMEALCGITGAFLPEIHALRPHPGQAETAAMVLLLVHGSERTDSRPDDVQDAYTLRCAPQVHGAAHDALLVSVRALEIEMNAVNDNPLVLPDGRVISGGHFHGEPIALPLDYAAIATAELANISERRSERMVNPQLSGLPAFLTEQSGLCSGYMIPQYAAAALVSENKVLAHPASVDSIPSSANKEDHVSMGAHAARKLARIVTNTARVLAIELMVAAQALDLAVRDGKAPAAATRAIHALVRSEVPHLTDDRVLSHDMERLYALVKSHRVAELVDELIDARGL